MFGLFKSSKKKPKENLTEKQKRRNVSESRRSAQQGPGGVEHTSAQWGDSRNRGLATKYEHSDIGFSGGKVGVSHRVSTSKDPWEFSEGKGFAKEKTTPHKERSRTAGFAKDIGKGVGEKKSQSDSSSGKPLGF